MVLSLRAPACLVAVAAAFGLAGCSPPPGGLLGRPATAPAGPASSQPVALPAFGPGAGNGLSRGAAQPLVLQVRFDILRASVPLGEISGSGKIWNHVDEEIIPADWAAHLQRNGMRVGRGNTSSWPPIRAILEAVHGTRTRTDSLIAPGGSLLTLELDTQPHDQVLFIYHPDGRAAGREFRRSMNTFRVEYAVPPTELDSVRLWIMPEIRQRELEPGWVMSGSRLRPAPPFASLVLRQLAFEALVPPEHFVMIGPSPEIRRAHLIGRAFLTETIDGQVFESVYFITPKVVRIGGPAPGGRSTEPGP